MPGVPACTHACMCAHVRPHVHMPTPALCRCLTRRACSAWRACMHPRMHVHTRAATRAHAYACAVQVPDKAGMRCLALVEGHSKPMMTHLCKEIVQEGRGDRLLLTQVMPRALASAFDVCLGACARVHVCKPLSGCPPMCTKRAHVCVCVYVCECCSSAHVAHLALAL